MLVPLLKQPEREPIFEPFFLREKPTTTVGIPAPTNDGEEDMAID
jgi:hypothetical protein